MHLRDMSTVVVVRLASLAAEADKGSDTFNSVQLGSK